MLFMPGLYTVFHTFIPTRERCGASPYALHGALPLDRFLEDVYLSAKVFRTKKASLVKGRGRGEAVTEGLLPPL